MISHSDSPAHSNPLFHKHKTLKVDDIYLLQLGTYLYMHQLHNKTLPYAICSIKIKIFTITILDSVTNFIRLYHTSPQINVIFLLKRICVAMAINFK